MYIHFVHLHLGTLHFSNNCAAFAVLYPTRNACLSAAIPRIFGEIQTYRLYKHSILYNVMPYRRDRNKAKDIKLRAALKDLFITHGGDDYGD